MRLPYAFAVAASFLASLLCPTAHAGQPHITSVDFDAVPVGETITFTGTGFADTSKVSFLFPILLAEIDASFNAVSDDTLEVTYPDSSRSDDDYFVLIETATGSTVSLAEDDRNPVAEFRGNGPAESDFSRSLIIKSGAVATSVPGFGLEFIYVEAGAVLQGIPRDSEAAIFAENGATLDFRGFDGFIPAIFYSPETTIVGTLPVRPPDPFGSFGNIVRQVTPLSLSRGIGTFTKGIPIDVTIIGDGTVTSNVGPFVEPFERFTLTATPNEGAIFSGWSGAVISQETTISLRASSTTVSVTATFTDGFKLDTFSSIGGTVSRDPDSECYAGGQEVTLTASASEGYEFVGWGADLSGITASTTTVTMDSNKAVTALFRNTALATPPLITSVDFDTVPVGETIAFSGTGFADTSKVSFLFPLLLAEIDASFNAVSDDTLEVTYPDSSRSDDDYFVLIETATGSTVSLADDDRNPVTEFSGNGPAESDFSRSLIIKSGAVATSVPGFGLEFIYVEAGAVLQGIPRDSEAAIFAENGATIDFRGFDGFIPAIFYSPETTIVGTLPVRQPDPFGFFGNIVRQVTPLSLSRGIGTFTEGIPIEITIIGEGTVTSSAGSFIEPFEQFTLTATPNEGATFSGWSGAVTSQEATISLRASSNIVSITATFTGGFTLETFASVGGTISLDPEAEFYSDGQEITLNASASEGYEFTGWGADLSGISDITTTLVMNSNKAITALFKDTSIPAPPQISSVDFTAVPVGETITFSGSGFEDTSKVSFLFPLLFAEIDASFNAVSGNTLEVIYPSSSRSSDDYFALIETATGSTVTLAEDGRNPIEEFTGNGPADADFSRSLIIKSGSIATSIPGFGLEFIYVEAGAVLQGIPRDSEATIFAENGATLDFRSSDAVPPAIIYSPETTIVGALPVRPPDEFGDFGNIVRQVTPLSLSRGIGTFTEGCRLDITITGSGSVTVEPDQQFFRRNEVIQVTAIPDEGSFFVRWAGLLSSATLTESLRVGTQCVLVARFSDRPDFFSGWRTRFFDEAELADTSISGPGADPDGDGFTNVAEYAFGTNPQGTEGGDGIAFVSSTLSESTREIKVQYTRPLNAADIEYQILVSKDLSIWEDGSNEDFPFTFVEERLEDLGDETERVTVAITLPASTPGSLFFQIGADLEDL